MSDLEIQPLQVPLKTAAELLGCCRATLYRMRDDGQISFGRMRGRTMVPMAEIHRVNALLYPEQKDAIEHHVGEPVWEPKKVRPKKIKLNPTLSAM
jgi:excisionase family DNA binding protein